MTSKLAQLDSMLDQTIKQLVGLKNALPETADPHLLELGHKYGLAVITDADKSTGAITFDSVKDTQKKICGELIASELGIYDPAMIQACRLQRLILCNDLRFQNRPLSGLAEVGRFLLDTLIFNAQSIKRESERGRATLHHELFHAIDYRDDLQHYADTEWRKLNGEDYKYNEALQFTAGAIYTDAAYFPPFDFEHLDGTPRGFLNQYATQSVREDKAVVYSWMLVRYSDLQEIARQDEIIASKLAYMKDLLAKFHPSFNDAFWQNIDQRSQGLKRKPRNFD